MVGVMDDDTLAELLALVRTGDHLDGLRLPPMSWAVHGLIPEGFGLFTGAPKAGKSWAALSIALAVAEGAPALGKVPTTPQSRPVLLLALEDGERRLQGRCRALLGADVPIPAQLHYVTGAVPQMVIPLLRAWLSVHGDARPLVILDTLGKVMPPAAPGEGAYQRDYRIGSVLKSTVDAHPGACLLVVHHTRKAGSEDWMDSTSGTNGLNGAADFTLNLSRTRNEDSGILRVSGRDVPENEYAVTNRDGRWTLDGDALADAARKAAEARATEGLGDRSAEVVAVVGRHPEGIGPAAVGRELGLTTERAGQVLTRLNAAGRIDKAGRGQYLPTPLERVESLDSSDRRNSPDSPLSTPPGQDCAGCGFPLNPSITADGFTTHPACEESA